MHTRSESSSAAQLLDINCSELDRLALEYLSNAELVEDTLQERPYDTTIRLAAFAAYQQIQQGNICNAMALISKYCPDILQDQRLHFRLKRQQFVELLRESTAAGDAAALACARIELAPLALDAYPEAYLDFKRALLMLVQPQQHEHWSLGARQKLAETVQHTMLLHLGVHNPRLSQLLVYLSHLFSLYSDGSHGSSRSGSRQVQQLLQAPGADLAKSMLLEERQEGALAPEVSGWGYVERDVQALMAAVSIPRRAAVNVLKAAGGDASAALATELMRFKLNVKHVDALVWEYAASRGLLEPSDRPTAAIGTTDGPATAAPSDMDIDQVPPAAVAAPAVGGAASGTCTSNTGTASAAQKRSNGGSSSCCTSLAPFHSPFTAAGPAGTQHSGLASAAGGSVAAAMLRSDSQSPPYKVPRWRCKQTASRFHGQSPTAAATTAASAREAGIGMNKQVGEVQVVTDSGAGSAASMLAAGGAVKPPCGVTEQKQQQALQQQQQLASGTAVEPDTQHAVAEQLVEAAHAEMQQARWQQLQQSLKSQATSGGSSSVPRQQEVQGLLVQLQDLAKQGRWDEFESLVDDQQPSLLQENHALKFDLKRCQFIQLVQANQLSAALQLARSQMTPLADKHPELLPSLKASMALLLPGPISSSSGVAANDSRDAASELDPSSRLLQQLLALLQSKFGVEPPMLVKLLRVLVTGHRAWFKVQRCQDPFATALGLGNLLQPEAQAAVVVSSGNGSTAGGTTAGGTTAAAAAAQGAAGAAAAASGGSEPNEEDLVDYEPSSDEERLHFDEAEVLQVMEVLELPRVTALELLAEHGGEAQAVIMQVFGA